MPVPSDQRPDSGSAKELEAASRRRLEADWQLSMSERLARMHELCRQMTQIAGAAKRPR